MRKIVLLIMLMTIGMGAGLFAQTAATDAPGPKFTVKTYPNPAKSICYVELDDIDESQPVHIEVVNALGSVIYKTDEVPSGKPFEIDIEKMNMLSGIYIVKVQHKGKTVTKRVVVQN